MERAAYEAQRAEHRFRAVEPENRLVARTLETEWEKRLSERAVAEAELARRERQRSRCLTKEQRQQIHALGADLKRAWEAPSLSLTSACDPATRRPSARTKTPLGKWEIGPHGRPLQYDCASDGRVDSSTDRRGVSRGSCPAILSPWQNPYLERLNGTIRRYCLDHVIVLNEAHLRRILTSYFAYYHESRAHLSLECNAPVPRRVEHLSEGKVIAIVGDECTGQLSITHVRFHLDGIFRNHTSS
ncbi:MAG: integrase core domain-containing protein [Phycisphaerae bacterium]